MTTTKPDDRGPLTLAHNQTGTIDTQEQVTERMVLARTRALLRDFEKVKLTDRVSFPPRRNQVMTIGDEPILFLGSAEVYEHSRPCLSLGAACGVPSEPIATEEKTETRGDVRIVRRIEAFSLPDGTPLKRWSITQFGECNAWYGFFDGVSIVEESRQAWLERHEAWRTNILAIDATIWGTVLSQALPYEMRKRMAERSSEVHFATEWTRRAGAVIRDALLTDDTPGKTP